jgi:hypothetical protein
MSRQAGSPRQAARFFPLGRHGGGRRRTIEAQAPIGTRIVGQKRHEQLAGSDAVMARRDYSRRADQGSCARMRAAGVS